MPQQHLSALTEFMLGGATGLLDCCLFHWIDTLKVRRQDNRPLLMDTSGKPLQLQRLGAPRFAIAAVRSLYAGFSTNLSLKLPYMACMFAFSAMNTRLLESVSAGSSPLATELASAALVGVEVSLLLSPLEMVRIQGQNCGKGGLLSASRAVAATGGLGVWGRGMTATMSREAKYCMGQFFLCDKIAQAVASRMRGGGGEGGGGDAAFAGGDGGGGGTVLAEVAPQVAGAVLGGIACTAVSHPDDVIKTRMQTHLRGTPSYATYPTYVATGLNVLRHEGVGALFNGAAFRCLLRVPLGLSVILVSGQWMRARLAERSTNVAVE